MKEKIHPKYVEGTIRCACGFTYKTYSTQEKMRVDICSQCHPFYTGKTKIIDSAGQVERYRRRFGETKATKILTASEKAKLEAEKAAKKAEAKKAKRTRAAKK
ncbi:50S ribosomal protein L31 [candidate division TA06 bacterium B3_TA06]|uniref:Large ribosomal subunit protein bL31 n=1 Tax=candidate division TA06 bacterium B3_TA06 TaxID=2012487 RepID=A0A532VB35_UNCT6|nr:MAG: 50S ribosomal protein L31 [candidate division TA06 bacterium B3_TA06]